MTSRGDFTRPRMRRFARGKAAAGAELGRIAAGAYKPWRAGRVSVSVGSRRKRRARPALHVATRREPPTIGQLADSASSWKAKNAVPQARRATATPKNAAFCRRCATRARRRATRQQGRGRSPGGATAIAAEHKNALPQPRRATATPQKTPRFCEGAQLAREDAQLGGRPWPLSRPNLRRCRGKAKTARASEGVQLPPRKKRRVFSKMRNSRAKMRNSPRATDDGPRATDNRPNFQRSLRPASESRHLPAIRRSTARLARGVRVQNHPSGLPACQTVRAAARPRRRLRQPAINAELPAPAL